MDRDLAVSKKITMTNTKQPNVFVSMDRENIEAYTPKYAVDIIIPYLDKEKVIWAPFSRDEHNFANYLRERGFSVINTHIDGGGRLPNLRTGLSLRYYPRQSTVQK